MDIINTKLAKFNNGTSQRSQRSVERKGGNPTGGGRQPRTCSYCRKREPLNARTDQKLKRCARCRTSLYCSRVCQRADWKKGHKRTCMPGGTVMAGDSGYLDSLPTEEMVMDQLIDAYRLRVEDERVYCGRLRGRYTASTANTEGNLATCNTSESNHTKALQYAFQDFQDFLDLAENTPNSRHDKMQDDLDDRNDSSSPYSTSSSPNTNDTDTDNSSASSESITIKKSSQLILPKWWNSEKRAVCGRRALNETSNGDGDEIWSSLLHPAGKDDILAHYQDTLMPMKLRMLAEKVCGTDVMGQPR